jgi:DNA helicase-2/ATP-dependent DNA helicase PcrA
MDYDDQMVYAYTILKKYPSILARVSTRYRYVCVDEAQDTSKIQHAIISLISLGHGNLFMVGDEDQSIYGFRAAYPEALLRFEGDHPGAKVLKIEQNFRSCAAIVKAADGFIAKNTLRHSKTMQGAKSEQGKLCEIALRGKTEQYSYLLKVARACREETAVLYRNNESALPLIDILEKFGVPYRVKALDTAFFTSRTVQDITNIVRFANNNCDTEAFMQIYYKINTHLSKAVAQAACDYCNREGMNVLDAVWEVGKIGMGTLKSCKAMKSHFMSLVTERGDKAIFRIVNYMGYGEYMDRMGINRSKAEILEAIGAGEPTAQSLIHRLSVLCELAREHRAPADCRFTLSTIHSAKGLEYDTVYLADVCDGVFPESTVINPKSAPKELLAAYEEERRLFYVGATRAKEKLFLFTYAGKSSQFCDELLGKEKAGAGAEKAIASVPIGKKRTEREIAEFCQGLTVGEELNHRAFGKGILVGIDGDIISVKFESGERKLSARMLLEMHLLI